MKKNDVFRWSFNRAYRDRHYRFPSFYLPVSKFAVFDGHLLLDTYWGHFDGTTYVPRPDVGCQWTVDEAKRDLDLRFMANLDDLEPFSGNSELYDDVIDLSRANSKALRFIRKGQQINPDLVCRHYARLIEQLEYEIESKQNEIRCLQQELTCFKK